MGWLRSHFKITLCQSVVVIAPEAVTDLLIPVGSLYSAVILPELGDLYIMKEPSVCQSAGTFPGSEGKEQTHGTHRVPEDQRMYSQRFDNEDTCGGHGRSSQRDREFELLRICTAHYPGWQYACIYV